MKLFGFYLLLTIVFLSCDQNKIYSEYTSDFENNRWDSNDTKNFSFTIEKDEVGDILLHLSHIYDYNFQMIPLQISIAFPDGHTEDIPINLEIKDANGKELGECSGDICDLYYTFKSKIHLKKGKYNISIENKKNIAYLPNILGVGIKVKR
ncbi:conserved hypothetical protein [Flavobacterium sp. 9AF]|uniref:hypothetical protein n=1 Tax=Flavobacterium sp. 9AF TaxID=2653142 RepID=UPI0012EF2374|nr:hypothetical protein [Flavobacterium sp. 9AF]VXB69038.1 conserved hypothetical protein [Flavobacterium sp. 9AF]